MDKAQQQNFEDAYGQIAHLTFVKISPQVDAKIRALYDELTAVQTRQTAWEKIRKVASGIVGAAVFLILDGMEFSGFPNEGVLLGLVFGIVTCVAVMFAVLAASNQATDASALNWLSRAEPVVGEHQGSLK